MGTSNLEINEELECTCPEGWEDQVHCVCWHDGFACCHCGAPLCPACSAESGEPDESAPCRRRNGGAAAIGCVLG